MKLNRTMKKFLAVVLSLALVVSSIAINSSTSKAADGDFSISIGELAWKNETDTIKSFSVSFSAVTGDGAAYDDSKLYYRIYIDAVSDDNAAINYSAGWNWIENIVTYGNDNEGFSNNHLFDGVFTTASGFNADDKNASTVLEAGSEHEVILAAYATRTDASANENAVVTASKAFTVPAEIETTTVADAETVVNIEVTAEIDANNGITASWTHPAGMESYAQEYYLGTAEEVIEDQAHWARNGTADWVWGNASGRQNVDNVVATNDRTINVANGGDYVVRVIYKDANGVIVARGTSPVMTFEKNVNLDMSAFQERNVELTAYLKWTRVTGAASYKVYDAEGTLVKDNVVADWADVNLVAYNTEYEYTIKAYDVDGVEIEGVTNNVVKAIVKDENYVETTTVEPSSEEPSSDAPVAEWADCADDANTDLGAWWYYVGLWGGDGATAQYMGGDAYDNFSLKVLTNNYGAWDIQAYAFYDVTAGVEYNYSITLNSDVAGAEVLLKEDSGIGDLQTKTLEVGDNVFEGKLTANDNELKMFFKLDTLAPGTTVSVTDFSITPVEKDTTTVDSGEQPTQPSYNPGFNPAELTYTSLACTGNDALSIDYAIQSTAVDGVAPWYGDGGNTFMVQFAATAGLVTSVTINGAEPAAGAITETAAGLVKINPTVLADNAYSVVNITTETGDIVVVIKKGTPVVEEPSSDESSSDESSSEDPSSDVPAVEYTQLENNGTVYVDNWELYNAGYEWGSGNSWLAYAGTTDGDLAIKVVASSGDSNSWELQAKKKNASIYEGLEVGKTYKVITTLDSTEAGAILSKLEGFNEGNTYQIVAGTNTLETIITYNGTPDGSAVLTLSGMPAGTVISNITYTLEETDPVPVTTTEAPTPGEDGFKTVYGNDAADITDLGGNWTMWVAGTHTLEVKVDEEDADHMQVKMTSNKDNWDTWAIQYKINKYGLTPGETYTMEIDFSADSTDFRPTLDGNNFFNGDMTETSTKVVATVTADAEGKVAVTVGLGYVGVGVTVDVSNIVVKDAEGNVVEVLDEAPIVETTTPDESSSDEQPSDETTTPEPTTPSVVETTTTEAPTTTVAPTTTKKAKVTKPGRTKVKKATKKKASKKVKISLKKIKGATKYQVQISKKKKFSKKNILVKKTVKKINFTIKKKKLANKKKLWVRARAIKVVNGKTYRGKWSKAKKVKIKK